MKAIIRFTKPDNKLAILTEFLQIIQGVGQLRQHMLRHGILFEPLSSNEIEILKNALIRLKYFDYAITDQALRLMIEKGEFRCLLKLLIPNPINIIRNDFAEFFWERGFAIDHLASNQVMDLRDLLEAIATVTIIPDVSEPPKPQPTAFTLIGIVKNQTTGTVLSDLQVTAQFQTDNVTRLSHAGKTNEQGIVHLPFDSALFDNLSKGKQILVVFAISQAGQSLTTSTTIGNLQPKNQQVEILVTLPESSSDVFIVRGTIRQADGTPLPGVVVQAFDQDMLYVQELGQMITMTGVYEISYKREQFRRAEQGSADLFIVVSYPNAPEITLAKSEIIFHARPIETIDLVVSKTVSEFEHYVAMLDSLREDRPVADFTLENIDFCAKEVGIPIQHIELLVAAFQLNRQTRLEAEVFYGIGRVLVLPALDLPALAQQNRETLQQALERAQNSKIVHFSEATSSILSKLLMVLGKDSEEILPEPVLSQEAILSLDDEAELTPRDFQAKNPALYRQLIEQAQHSLHKTLIADFEEASFELKHFIRNIDLTALADLETTTSSYLSNAIRDSQLSEPIQQEGQIRIQGWHGPQTLGDILKPDISLKTNPLFVDTFQQAGVFRVGALSQLSDEKVQRLLNHGFRLDEVSPDKLDALVAEGLLNTAEAEALGTTANLYQFADNNMVLVDAIKTLNVGQQSVELKDLLFLDPNNWEPLLEQFNVSPPDRLSRKDYATILQNRIEILFPNDVFRSKYRPIESNSFNRNLEQLVPIFIQNDHLFDHIPFSALDLDNIDDKLRPILENAYGEINRWVNRYPGLELSKVLTDKALTTKDKLVEAERRVNLLAQFYQANEASSFLFLDYSPDSKDLEQLHLANFTASDRRLILNNLKTDQILYQITNNAEHAYVLKESGFHATYQIATESLYSFVQKTKLPQAIAQQYHRNAKVGIGGIVNGLGIVIDLVKNPLQGSMADNASPEISQYLQRLEGYSTLFGSQDFCKCQHCQSILSPVAYFVDLMDFLKTHILDEYFTGSNAIHPLNPYNRRRDLWESLPLTCDATHTLVPYLTIILEILENYIFRVRGIPLLGRENIESAVYRFLYEQGEVDNEVYIYSFRQPFCLPLVELQTYLQHFPTTRAEIARTVLAYQQDTAEIIPQAELKVSRREYEMIQSRPLNSVDGLDTEFLTRLYRFNVASNPEPESKDLLILMEISRQQLTELVATRFIAANGARVSFEGTRHDGDTTLQPDKEVVKGLTPEILDRMHRFVRLWRRLDWSMTELDQILFHIYEARGHSDTDRNQLPLPLITQLHTLQKYLKVSVPELCALFHRVPNDGKGSLCDRLFNLPVFTRSHGGGAAWPSDETVQYPYPSASTDLVTIQRLHRLLAGLGLKDDELFRLMENLRIPLGGPSEGAFSFTLNLDNLSLLYRHARLTKLLRLDVRELFALLRMAPDIPSNHVSNLETLQSLIDMVSWQKKSGYSIQELAIILDDRYVASSSEAATTLTPRDISESIVEQILADRSLIFRDTLFSYFEGITEAQSQAIIRANTAVIVPADIRTYRIAATVTDPGAVTISLPSDISSALTDAQPSQLDAVIREIIATYRQPGAPDISDRILVGVVGLTALQSRAVLNENPTVFEPVDNPYFWLSPDFGVTGILTIPAGTPLRGEEARNFLSQFHASEVVAHQLGRQFNLPVEKIKALSLLAGYKSAPDTLGIDLTRLLHGDSGYLQVLIDLVTSLKKLSLWFKDKSFDTEALTFIQAQSGGTDKIFHIELEHDREPSLANLQQTVKFQQLLKSLRTSKTKPKHLFLTLLAFDHTSLRFDPNRANDQITALLGVEEELIDSLKAAFGAEEGLLNSLNNSKLFAASWGTTTSDSVNRALAAFDKLTNCIKLAQFLGIGGEAFELILSEGYTDLNQAVAIVVTAIRTKYESEESYQEKIGAFEDQIREQKRDALTDFLIHSETPEEERIFRSSNDLYHYFLIDTELEGCARTSRVVAGTASLQLYIQRCLMNLEQSEDGSIHVRPQDNPEDEWQWRQEWEWRKNYRVWEANRKVFLFAENYIEPDLRDDKTQLFEETVSELLQKEINAQSVVDAYAKYMKGFEEIAQLNIAGAFHDRDNGADVLHLFGVTASEPPQYYYRTIENIYKSEEQPFKKGVVWNSWQKINLQIPVRKVSPIIYKGKLYVFWVQITTRPKNENINGTSFFSGYRHTMTVKFSALQLDGTWLSPQTIDLTNEVFENGAGVIDDSLATSLERSLIPSTYRVSAGEFFAILLSHMRDINPEERETKRIIFSNPLLSELSNLISLQHAPMWRNLLVPTYDPLRHIHAEAVDSYTLKGPRWDQVYPSTVIESPQEELMLVGRDFALKSFLDIFSRKIGSNISNSSESLKLYRSEGKRLKHRNNSLSFGYLFGGSDFADTVRYLEGLPGDRSLIELFTPKYLLTLGGANKVIVSINGALTDALINVDGDLLYLHSYEKSGKPYAIDRLGTTLGETISRQLFENGIEGLLNIDFQSGLAEARLPVLVPRNASLVAPLALDGELDTHGSLGVYFREMFFHVPFLIANHLNSQGKYADAQRWYHYIFDPTSDKVPPGLDSITDPEKRKKHQAKRVWQYIEFRDHTLQTLRQQLDDPIAVEAYRKDPFNPHAIARLRLDAYKKSVVMKYIDNLLDWGDQLFTQDTRESINEATLLYIMAAEILGPRPLELGDCRSKDHPDNPTYRQINDQINQPATANFYTEIETLRVNKRSKIPDTGNVKNTRVLSFQTLQYANHINVGFSHNSSIGSFFQGLDWKKVGSTIRHAPSLASFGTSLLKQATIFCIPPNPDLIGYWDRVEDRLYKIRNCMNISGLRRDLALFAPEIDPRLLVRARAEGIPLEDVLNSISGNLPPYRFSFLIIKAKEYTSALQSFGAALLSAIEKKEAEELVRLRLIHQDTILKLSRKLRDQEVEAAEASLESLKLRELIVIARRDYFQSLKDAGLSEWENLQVNTKLTSHGLLLGSAIFMMTGSGLTFAPQILGMSNSTPAKSSADGAIAFAGALQFLSQISNIVSDIAGVQAHFQRREQGWDFSLQQSKGELKELEKQIRGAEIRRDISIQSREIHEKSIEQSGEIYEFYQDKFTNLGLYTWLSTQLQRLYRQAYQDALAVARLAERAFRFERGDDTTPLLSGQYWDATHSGLLAGEKLMGDLRAMELRYMETHYRSMEIDQAFSLTQINPAALIRLKETGECSFDIPELYFDLFYPGHYRRRIKSARLTIPCITGPYTNIGATLTLTGSKIRKDPIRGEENLLDVPPTRSVSIATSTAQNDSGVFHLDFRDERYMPFEGAGAISAWKLSLPKSFRQFDYQTINDVILHISYTAQDDGVFRQQIEGSNAEDESEIRRSLQEWPLWRAYSLRQEFSNPYNRLLRSAVGEPVKVEFSEKRFPLFLQGVILENLEVQSAQLVLVLNPGQTYGEFSMQINGEPVPSEDPGTEGSSFVNSALFDNSPNLPSIDITSLFSGKLTENLLGSHGSSREHTFIIDNAGDLAPDSPAPSDLSAIDAEKLKDILILIEYRYKPD